MSFLGPRPQRRGLVDGFPLAGGHHLAGLALLLALFPLFAFHLNGQADVVGILAHQLAQAPAVGKLQRIVAQVQRHAGAALGACERLHLELARARAAPAHALLRRQAGAARLDHDAVGHDEAGIKPHAELADQLRIGLGVARQARRERPRAALGDGAQVLHRLLLAHADAGIAHRERARLPVEGDAHAQIGLLGQQRAVVQRLEAQLVAGIGGVGDQLAQKNFGVGIQRMRDQVQHLGHFGLKTVFLLVAHGLGLGWRR